MAVTDEQVAELYVAYFDRAPDAAGLAYWVASDMTMEEISASFYVQPETTEKYPDTMTDSVFVDSIYQNVFNREADDNGLTYWVDELEAGTITRAKMILAIVDGAQNSELGNDQSTLDNKTEVGLYFAATGSDDVEEAVAVMSDVDDTVESVNNAKDEIDGEAPVTTFALTTKADTIVGSAVDDIVTGVMNAVAATATYTAGDTIDGKDGTDTFKATLTATSVFSNPVTNVEKVIVTPTVTAQAIDVTNWSGVEDYTFSYSSGAMAAVNIDNIREDITSVGFTKTTGASTVTMKTLSSGVFGGSDDTLGLTLSKAVAGAITSLDFTDSAGTGDIIENYNITTSANGAGSGITLSANDDKVKTITVSGDSTFDLVTTAATATTALTTVDASGLLGDFAYTATTIKTGGTITIKGGEGDDTLKANAVVATAINSVLEGNAGDDTLDGGDKNDTIKGGEGKDTIKAYDGANIITGGTEKDTMTITVDGIADKFIFDYSNDSGITAASADVIVGFTTTVDKLSFDAVAAGSAQNFISIAGTGATIDLAVAEVNNADLVGKTYVYHKASNSLIVDVDDNGYADTAIKMTAVADMEFGDII